MCGILGAVGRTDVVPLVIDGLRRLEYRGYDSAGVAVLAKEGLVLRRSVGAVDALAALRHAGGTVVIGHTRWATHGPPTERNAHPHTDCGGRIAVAHNGIIENHLALREKLLANGHVFTSDTDTEVISHLIEEHFRGDLLAAVRAITPLLEGSYALVVVSADTPGRIVATRRRSPLLLGLAEDLTLVASDATPLHAHTRQVAILEDGQIAELTVEGTEVFGERGEHVELTVHELATPAKVPDKEGHEHFMLKEIHDIPAALRDLLHGRIGMLGHAFDMEGALREEELRAAERIVVVACGTSYYAGIMGKSIIERLAHLPVSVELASEYRYAPSFDTSRTIFVFVSQSGETADTLEALRITKERGARTLALVNVEGSSLAREAHGVFPLRAGPEVGVASTKAFVNTLGAFYLLGAHLGQARGSIGTEQAQKLATQLAELPSIATRTFAAAHDIQRAGEEFFHGANDAFFLGRQSTHALALEGALKLKEISYVHAEGYAAGELKHGPLALLHAEMPVTALLSKGDPTHAIMLANIVEVKARGAKVLGVIAEGDEDAARVVDRVVRIPATDPLFYPIPASIALYLLAYHAAKARGCPIDRPRNLAKSVTVE